MMLWFALLCVLCLMYAERHADWSFACEPVCAGAAVRIGPFGTYGKVLQHDNGVRYIDTNTKKYYATFNKHTNVQTWQRKHPSCISVY